MLILSLRYCWPFWGSALVLVCGSEKPKKQQRHIGNIGSKTLQKKREKNSTIMAVMDIQRRRKVIQTLQFCANTRHDIFFFPHVEENL